jgi:hypothetical protein
MNRGWKKKLKKKISTLWPLVGRCVLFFKNPAQTAYFLLSICKVCHYGWISTCYRSKTDFPEKIRHSETQKYVTNFVLLLMYQKKRLESLLVNTWHIICPAAAAAFKWEEKSLMYTTFCWRLHWQRYKSGFFFMTYFFILFFFNFIHTTHVIIVVCKSVKCPFLLLA